MTERPLRILIVDDNKDVADTECMILSIQGYDCEIACDVPSGVEAAIRLNPDVVLFDLRMPGDGFRLPGLLRELPGPMPALVAITGVADSATGDRLRSLGVEHHFAKPVAPARLLDLLVALDRGRN